MTSRATPCAEALGELGEPLLRDRDEDLAPVAGMPVARGGVDADLPRGLAQREGGATVLANEGRRGGAGRIVFRTDPYGSSEKTWQPAADVGIGLRFRALRP